MHENYSAFLEDRSTELVFKRNRIEIGKEDKGILYVHKSTKNQKTEIPTLRKIDVDKKVKSV